MANLEVERWRRCSDSFSHAGRFSECPEFWMKNTYRVSNLFITLRFRCLHCTPRWGIDHWTIEPYRVVFCRMELEGPPCQVKCTILLMSRWNIFSENTIMIRRQWAYEKIVICVCDAMLFYVLSVHSMRLELRWYTPRDRGEPTDTHENDKFQCILRKFSIEQLLRGNAVIGHHHHFHSICLLTICDDSCRPITLSCLHMSTYRQSYLIV